MKPSATSAASAFSLLRAAARGADLPEPGARGLVHSVFARACNLRFDGRLVVLLGPDLPLVSWGLRLRHLPRPFTALVRPDAPCRLDQGRLMLGTGPTGILTVDMSTAVPWREDRLPPGAPVPAWAWSAPRLAAARRSWPGLCALFAPGKASPEDASGGTGHVEGLILSLAGEAARDLRIAWNRADGTGVGRAARRLTGLGPGLTPAGDDFLGGFLAGCFAQARGGSDDATTRLLARTLWRALPDAPVSVARMFLNRACVGSFSESLAALARLLGRSGRPDAAASATMSAALEAATERLLAFGASSGADALAGLLAAAPAPDDAPGRAPVRSD